jgi:hypothetical protein
MADVNGDGRVDLVGFRETGTFVALGLGNGTFGTFNTASAALGRASASRGWTSQDCYLRTLADANGDRRAEIVGFGEAGTHVALASGNGGFDKSFLATNRFGASDSSGAGPVRTSTHAR